MAFIHKGKEIKSVSFFGFGKSNASVFEYLNKRYPELKFSAKPARKGEKLPGDIRILKASDDFSEDLVFVSPSIRRDSPELLGKLLSSDAELFFEQNKSEVFAVTGSDGKSTTVTLSALLTSSPAIGNIGIPFTRALENGKTQRYVTELSSFQLMNFAPKSKRAIITNISENHLDWHLSYDEYISAKENVLKNTEEPVFFLDSDKSFELYFRNKASILASPKLSESEIRKHKAQTYIYIKDGAIYANGERLIGLSELSLRGEHNVKNFLSAIALTYGFFDKSNLMRVAQDFHGLPHRFELADEVLGVKFYNSSIDSSPARSFVTLSSCTFPYVLIMGGRTKMRNFEILADILEKNSHALVLIGENQCEIYEKLKSLRVPIYKETSLESATKKAYELAKGVCDVILSPASVSYDAFSDFEKRGEAYRLAIRKINTTDYK